MTKKELRDEIKEKRALLTKEYKEQAGSAVQKYLLESDEYRNAESIFVYTATENEPDTEEIIRISLEKGKRVYVPRCISKGKMVAVQIDFRTVFEEGYMGIREPAVYDEDFSLKQVDLSVIPCVSASLSGERLGHGAGFYDIFLENTETVKVCLCFHLLISDTIPTQSTDIKMDAVITEKGIFYCTDEKC